MSMGGGMGGGFCGGFCGVDEDVQCRLNVEVFCIFGFGGCVIVLFCVYCWWIFFMGVLVVVGVVIVVVFLLIVQCIFDDVLFLVVGGGLYLELFGWFVVVMVGFFLLLVVLGVVQIWFIVMVGNSVIGDFCVKFFEYLQVMELGFFICIKMGVIQLCLQNDVGGVFGVLINIVMSIFGNVVMVIVLFVVMILIDWWLMFIVVIMMFFLIVVQCWVGQVRVWIVGEIQELLLEFILIMQEMLSVFGMLLLKVFNWQCMELQCYQVENCNQVWLQVWWVMSGQGFFVVVQVFMVSVFVVIYLVLGYLIVGGMGVIMVGIVVVFIMVQVWLFMLFMGFMCVLFDFQIFLVLFVCIFEYFDLVLEIEDVVDVIIVDEVFGLCGWIEFVDVVFCYLDVLLDVCLIFDGVFFVVEFGKQVVFVGFLGVGKMMILYFVL